PIHFSFMHGVRASLALQQTGDLQQALAQRNPDVAPHLSFMDAGGHGYSVVRANKEEVEGEFVCIPRPLDHNEKADSGPLAYRVAYKVKQWERGLSPRLERTLIEGTLPL